MSRTPWRDTSTDIAGGQPPQWETPQGAQVKADEALKESKDYTDEQNVNFNAHIEDTTIHVTPADKTNWNSKAPGVHTHPNATPTTPGFMSAEDKTKLNGVEAEANKYVHPATHPPAIIAQDTENRFVSDAEKAGWSGKAEPTEATTTVKGLMSPTDKQKLNGIQAAAEVNQNAFSKVNDVEASSKTDTLQLTGGTGITVTTDPSTKRVIVTSTGTATPGAHASSHVTGGSDVIPDAVTGGASGLMSGTDAKFVRQDGESKTGAQAKADAAELAAKNYTDGQLGTPTSAATANTIVKRDASARFKSAAPVASDDVARKLEVDSAITTAASDATNKANTAEANAKSSSLPLAGGTLTGPLTLSAGGVFLGSGGRVRDENAARTIIQAHQSRLDVTNQSASAFLLSYQNEDLLVYLTGGAVASIAAVKAASDKIKYGTGSPEGIVSSPVGTIYLRSDGGASTTLYVKQSGTGNTGWVAK
ncbi:hypothetical protein [Paenibacillus sp. FSL K6-0108]|uniref:hypothetical protein n=1 Tax=Paenibacillus sp. FSL K6-0108 TaxID=2921417 RepID=UPI00324363F8